MMGNYATDNYREEVMVGANILGCLAIQQCRIATYVMLILIFGFYIEIKILKIFSLKERSGNNAATSVCEV